MFPDLCVLISSLESAWDKLGLGLPVSELCGAGSNMYGWIVVACSTKSGYEKSASESDDDILQIFLLFVYF